MSEASGADRHETVFRGTPREMEAWLREFFDLARVAARKLSGSDEDVMERVERDVWELRIAPTGQVQQARVRDEFCDRVAVMDLAFDMLDILGVGESGHGAGQHAD